MRASLVCVCVSFLLAGCTVLTSDSPLSLKGEGQSARGVYYALPKGLINLTLLANEAGQFELIVGQPKYIPDPNHRYFLRYQPHLSYDDEIKITMNENGRPFLSKIESKTTDRTKDIILDLARAAAFTFQSALTVENARLLADATLDPSDPNSVSAAREEIYTAMHRFVTARHKDCLRNPPPTLDANASDEDKKAVAAAKALCRHFSILLTRDAAHKLGKGNGETLFMLSVADPPAPPKGRAADCSVGVCYRPKVPYIIAYAVAGVVDTRIVELPNGTSPIAIDISRAFLVKRFQELDFDDDGFLTRAKIEKDSELLAAAQLPLQVVDAVLDGLQLRIKLTQDNTGHANTEAGIIKQRADLRKRQQEARRQVEAAAAKSQSTPSPPPSLFRNVEASAGAPASTQPPLDTSQ